MFTPFSFLISCEENQNLPEEKNIYVASVTNLSTQHPFHEVLVQKEDSLWKYDFWNNEKTLASAHLNTQTEEAIVFSNQDSLAPLYNYTLFEDLHFFIHNEGFKSFVATPKGASISTEEFLSFVQQEVFETSIQASKTPNSSLEIKEKIQFQGNRLIYFWEYYYQNEFLHAETEEVELSFFEVEDQLFLIPSTQENPYPIFQVKKVTQDKIELVFFTDFEAKTNLYSKVEKDTSTPYQSYSLCKDSFQSLYYVGEDVRYAKGMDHLLNYLQQDAPKSDKDALINLHFTVNCNGEVGKLGLEVLDRNYQKTSIHPEIVKHIIEKVLQLKDWDNVDKINYRGAKDAKLFFLIQVTNQKISEVCP